MNLEPYQLAGQEIQKRGQRPINLIKTAGAIAGGAGVGGVAKRILPFLNQFIPNDLMRKGLAKVDPRIGKFMETAINNGYSVDQLRDFLSSKFVSSENPQETQNEESPKVSQHSTLQEFETTYPDIAQALNNTIQQGQTPQAAAAILKTSSLFGKQIKKIEKDIGKNFIDYILELLGPQQTQTVQPPQPVQSPQAIQQPQQQIPPQQAQGENIDQALLAALDKILKM